MKLRSVSISAALMLALNSSCALADLSTASRASAYAAGSVVAGSLTKLMDSSQVLIEGVEQVRGGLKLTLKGSAHTLKAVLIIPAHVAGAASLAVGQTVQVVAEGAGWLLTQGGKVLAFVPNEAGKALLFSKPEEGT